MTLAREGEEKEEASEKKEESSEKGEESEKKEEGEEDDEDGEDEQEDESVAAARQEAAKASAEFESFQDQAAFAAKVQLAVGKIENETSSPEMATFLGEMRTEMREYAQP